MVELTQRTRHGLAAGSVMVVALALYVPTLLPDVGTWDTAEFQAIGPVLGIAHPTGYPTYTLTAWLASVVLQPFGNEAYRADLLSALLLASAAALAAIAVVQLTRRAILGFVAGAAFAVTPIAWGVATRADAHALHVFFAALILVLLIGWAQRQHHVPRADHDHSAGERPGGGGWLVGVAIVYGLSLGNHALTLLLAPGIAAFILLVAPRLLRRQTRLVVACAAILATTAVLVYAYLPLRSVMDPALDYADPQTWASFWYVVLGEQFQGSFRPLPAVGDIVAGIWDELVRNLGVLVILVPAGAILGAIRHHPTVVLTGLWLVSTWIFALGYPNAVIERYYLVPLLAAVIWIALGAGYAWDAIATAVRGNGESGRRRLTTLVGGAVAGLLVVAVLVPISERYDRADRSGPTFGRTWLEAALAALEPNAAVMSWWSYSTPLWYGQAVEGRRPDVLVVDDRDVLDDGYGNVEGAIDRFIGTRPVYVVRLDRDLPRLRERYVLERIESVPGPGDLYRVRGRRSDDAAAPT